MQDPWTIIALVCAVVSGATWFAFLRPVRIQQAAAVIQQKTHKLGGTYWQQQVGVNRGFRTAIPISVAECFVLELHSDELGRSGFFSIDPSESEKYAVGQRVVIDYQRHGLPLIGYKITVLAVVAAVVVRRGGRTARGERERREGEKGEGAGAGVHRGGSVSASG